jgi:hypothetical protein
MVLFLAQQERFVLPHQSKMNAVARKRIKLREFSVGLL